MPNFEVTMSGPPDVETFNRWTKPTELPGHFAAYSDEEIIEMRVTVTLKLIDFGTSMDAEAFALGRGLPEGWSVVETHEVA